MSWCESQMSYVVEMARLRLQSRHSLESAAEVHSSTQHGIVQLRVPLAACKMQCRLVES